MKNIFYYLTLVFSIFILSACSPNQDGNGDFLNGVKYDPTTTIPGDGGPTASRLLKKMNSHLKDEDTGEFEDSNLVFGYDSTNRLISYSEAGSSEKFNIQYNSSNKISRVYVTGGINAVYEYSGGNVSKITTTITGISTSVTNYTFTGNKMVKSVSITTYTLPIPMKIYMEDTYEYSGENLVKDVTKLGSYDPDTGVLIMEPTPVTAVYAYDNKKSPFALLPKEFWIFFSSISPQTGFFLSQNNPTKATITEQDGTVKTQNSVNTYDSENYLIKSTSGDEYYIYGY